MMIMGRRATVSWEGAGSAFREIWIDGRRSYSAVMTSAAEDVVLKRGVPDHPYLARATGKVARVGYDAATGSLSVRLVGVPGMRADIEVVSTTPVRRVVIDGADVPGPPTARTAGGVYRTSVAWRIAAAGAAVEVFL
jgi:hypothetical protein